MPDKPRNLVTKRATLDHLHLEALAERGFVAASGDDAAFILDLKLTADAHATLRYAYRLLREEQARRSKTDAG